jgi:hypothetical protein
MQSVEGFLPTALIDELVPLRNKVVYGTTGTGLAKGNAAVHATSALTLELPLGWFGEDLVEVTHTFDRIPIRNGLSGVLHEA